MAPKGTRVQSDWHECPTDDLDEDEFIPLVTMHARNHALHGGDAPASGPVGSGLASARRSSNPPPAFTFGYK